MLLATTQARCHVARVASMA